MEKEFIPYAEALALKELGFDESTYTWRQHGNGISGDVEGKRDYYNRKGDVYTALPLYQQAFRWFREKYGLQHEITRQGTNYWLLTILEIDKVTINGIFNGKKYDIDDYIKNEPKSYEESELECLKKLIEIVKNDVELQTKNN